MSSGFSFGRNNDYALRLLAFVDFSNSQITAHNVAQYFSAHQVPKVEVTSSQRRQ